MADVTFTVKSTGKTYTMPWDGEEPPSKLDLKQYAWEQENKSLPQRAWETVNKPIVDVRGSQTPEMKQAMESFDKDYPKTGAVKNFGLDLMSSMTSPLSLSLEGLTAAAPVAKALGFGKTANTLRNTSRAAGAGMLGHGSYRAVTGKTMADKAGGVLEAVGGAFGARGVKETAPQSRALPDIDAPPEMPNVRRIGRGRTPFASGPSSLDPNVVKDAEYVELPDLQISTPNRKALPPAADTYYSGRGGASTNLSDFSEPIDFARSPEEAAHNALIPERFKPHPSNTGTTGAYRPIGPIEDATYTGTGKLEDLGEFKAVDQTRVKTPASEAPTAYSKSSDADVEFLANDGDPIAIAEARKRPSLAERLFKNEKGAVGDQSGPQNTDELAASLGDKDKEPTATFKGYQDDGQGGRLKLYDIVGGPHDRSTVSEAKLNELGIKVPPDVKNPASELRMQELLKKFGGKLLSDEDGFLKVGKKGENPYLDRFANWVNNVKSSKIEGILKRREFKDLDDQGFDAITRFQAGDRTGRLADVEKYFKGKLEQLTSAGVHLNEHENYLPQLWEDPPGKVKEVYRRLGLRPSFTLTRVFDDYKQGIENGLTPKFKNIGELAGWYEQKANKAIADREFYNLGRENGWIRPQGKGEEDWKILDPNHFPAAYTVNRAGQASSVPMTAPPELHELISNYLDDPNKIIQWMADKASMSKNIAMSSGIPMTGVNAHGFNILARTVIGNPKAALTAGKYILNPRSAGRALDEALHTAPWAVKQGLQLTTEGHEMGVSGSTNLAGRTFQKFLKVQGKLFEDPLFQNVIPALKLKHFNDMVGDLIKNGMSREAAGKSAAEMTNNLYGGINWEAMGRSRDLQNLARMVVLAPDWLESNVRLGNGMAKTLLDPKNPQGKFYAKMARNIIGAYMAADISNYAMSGHHMWENPAGHALDIQAGKSNGKDRWIRPFGTAADFLRLPYDAASAALARNPDFGTPMDIAKNRMSIPARVGLDLITKRDRSNRPILGKDDYGRPIPPGKQIAGTAGELSSLVLPPYAKSVLDYSTGQSGAEEALMGTGEMPVRYSHIQKRRSFGRKARR